MYAHSMVNENEISSIVLGSDIQMSEHKSTMREPTFGFIEVSESDGCSLPLYGREKLPKVAANPV